MAAVRVIRFRPTIAIAARLSDRHCGWDDLLATALTTRRDADPYRRCRPRDRPTRSAAGGSPVRHPRRPPWQPWPGWRSSPRCACRCSSCCGPPIEPRTDRTRAIPPPPRRWLPTPTHRGPCPNRKAASTPVSASYPEATSRPIAGPCRPPTTTRRRLTAMDPRMRVPTHHASSPRAPAVARPRPPHDPVVDPRCSIRRWHCRLPVPPRPGGGFSSRAMTPGPGTDAPLGSTVTAVSGLSNTSVAVAGLARPPVATPRVPSVQVSSRRQGPRPGARLLRPRCRPPVGRFWQGQKFQNPGASDWADSRRASHPCKITPSPRHGALDIGGSRRGSPLEREFGLMIVSPMDLQRIDRHLTACLARVCWTTPRRPPASPDSTTA